MRIASADGSGKGISMPNIQTASDLQTISVGGPPCQGKKPLTIVALEKAVQAGIKEMAGEHFDIHERPDRDLIPVPCYANTAGGDIPVATVTVIHYYGHYNFYVYELLDGGDERGDLLLEGSNWKRRGM